jgi:hypothetical protein
MDMDSEIEHPTASGNFFNIKTLTHTESKGSVRMLPEPSTGNLHPGSHAEIRKPRITHIQEVPKGVRNEHIQAARDAAKNGIVALQAPSMMEKARLQQEADARVAFDSRKGNREAKEAEASRKAAAKEAATAAVRHAVNNMQLRLANHGQISYSDGHGGVAVMKSDPEFVQIANKMVVQDVDKLMKERAALAATISEKDIKAGYKERAKVSQRARRAEEKKNKTKEMPGTSKS